MRNALKHIPPSKTVAISLVTLVVIISWTGLMDKLVTDYVNSSTVQALAAYALARTLNAIVTVAASLQISFQFMGGVSIQPLEILDPLNDLVEQYSSVMKFAIASLLTQKILIEIVSTTIFKFLITFSGIAFAVSLYFDKNRHSVLLMKTFVTMAMVRFLFILVVLFNGIVDKAFIDPYTTEDMNHVSAVTEKIELMEHQSDLSQEERGRLQSRISELTVMLSAYGSQIEAAEKSITGLNERIESAESDLEAIESGMTRVERINRFSRTESHTELLDKIDELIKERRAFESEIKEKSNHRAASENEIANIKDVLEGRAEDGRWFGGLRDRMAMVADFETYTEIKERMEMIIPSILNLMALFTFKTLIMPLIFLAILLRGFKAIWGIDPRAWVRQEYEALKKE